MLLLLYSIIITLCDNLFSEKKKLLSGPGLKLSGRIFFTGRMFFFLYFGKILVFFLIETTRPSNKTQAFKEKGKFKRTRGKT